MKNKFGQFLSSLLIQTYGLPPPFTLLPSLLGCMRSHTSSTSRSDLNPVSTDMVLRLLHELSITLGSDATIRAFRSRERVARDTAIRDEIRASHSVGIANSVWKVIEEGLSKIEQMAAQDISNGILDSQGWNMTKAVEVTCEATTVIGDYASWIDISLIVTPMTMSLLYRLLQQNEVSLRIAAADALLEIATKGMNGEDKIKLLRALNLTSTISELEKGTRRNKSQGELSDGEVSFREHLARLANGVGIDLVRILEGPKSPVANMTKAASEARAAADEMLLSHLGIILDFLTDEWDELAEAVLPCIGETLAAYKKLRRTGKAAASGADVPVNQLSAIYTPAKAAFLSRLMNILLVKMKFDDETEWNGGGGKAAESDGEDSEEEEIGKFLQLRKVSLSSVGQNCSIMGSFHSTFTHHSFHRSCNRMQLPLQSLMSRFLVGRHSSSSWKRCTLAMPTFPTLVLQSAGNEPN